MINQEYYFPLRLFEALGEQYYSVVRPASFPRQIERFRNQRWAERVGLAALEPEEWAWHFGSFAPLPGAQRAPLALGYHGHQFDVYNSALGDGRGFLFAQLRDQAGRALDLGTKGSGKTPYSRGGDGRLTLKGGVREVLAAELLEALGVYTSKAFSLFETGEALQRNDEPSPTRSSVLVRLSHSHVRIGAFQRLLTLNKPEAIERLVSYSNEHLLGLSASAGAEEFLREVARRLARTTGAWLAAGFVHGVLNSDNMNITGESFDYGPYRFLKTLDPSFTAAYFDHTGLYSYGNQPRAVLKNLMRLAACLTHLTREEERLHIIHGFEAEVMRAHAERVVRRLGLDSAGGDLDESLTQAIITFLQRSQAPFAGFFFDWCGGLQSKGRALAGPRADFYQRPEIEPVLSLLQGFSVRQGLDLGHAYFQRAEPCDLLIEEVEAIWAPIAERDDWAAFYQKVDAIRELGRIGGARFNPAQPTP